jgi:intracellular sulfur oxidation DsrE/DsrF family protein
MPQAEKTDMKTLLSALVLGVLALAIAPNALAETGYGQQKVVYHINYDDQKHLKGAMRNIQNHINAVGEENLDLKVVLHGNGVALLSIAKTDPNFESMVVSLKSQDVSFEVCNNTLTGRKINYETDLYDVEETDIVPSGVAELAKLQAEGYTYIKP